MTQNLNHRQSLERERKMPLSLKHGCAEKMTLDSAEIEPTVMIALLVFFVLKVVHLFYNLVILLNCLFYVR